MKHRFVVLFIVLQIAAAAALYAHSVFTSTQRSAEIEAGREVVRALSLTDPSLWSEAHYTRNPTQSDRFAPFQDFPGAMEHFPAGSLVKPAAVDRGR